MTTTNEETDARPAAPDVTETVAISADNSSTDAASATINDERRQRTATTKEQPSSASHMNRNCSKPIDDKKKKEKPSDQRSKTGKKLSTEKKKRKRSSQAKGKTTGSDKGVAGRRQQGKKKSPPTPRTESPQDEQQQQEEANDENDNDQRYLIHAIRPGNMIELPAIFFGVKDFNSFLSFAIGETDQKEPFEYRIFYELTEALEYIGMDKGSKPRYTTFDLSNVDTEPANKKRKVAPTPQEQQENATGEYNEGNTEKNDSDNDGHDKQGPTTYNPMIPPARLPLTANMAVTTAAMESFFAKKVPPTTPNTATAAKKAAKTAPPQVADDDEQLHERIQQLKREWQELEENKDENTATELFESSDMEEPTPKKRKPRSKKDRAPRKQDPSRQAQKQASANTRWEEKFELLRKYKAEFGHCNAPAKPNDDEDGDDDARQRQEDQYKAVRNFVVRQRALIRADDADPSQETTMTEDRRQRLVDIGLLISKKRFNWEDKFDLLQQYKREHGDCNVPNAASTPEKYKSLVTWLQQQRRRLRAYENNEEYLTADDGDETEAEEQHQQRYSSSFQLTADRRQRLLDLGVTAMAEMVTRNQQWEKQFELLLAYKNEYGNCNGPVAPSSFENSEDEERYKAQEAMYKPLRSWVQKQRYLLKASDDDSSKANSKTLTVERKQRLVDIGVLCHSQALQWEKKFELLQDYQKEYGHCNGPVAKSSFDSKEEEEEYKQQEARYKPLKVWVATQRRHLKAYDQEPSKANTSSLTADRRERLLEIGLLSDNKSLQWEEMLEQLKAYRAEHGDCNVPIAYSNRALAAWVAKQRRKLRILENKGDGGDDPVSKSTGNKLRGLELSEERRQQLLDIGLTAKVVHKNSSWDIKFELLKQYKEEYGSLDAPTADSAIEQVEKYKALKVWISNQRAQLRGYEEDPSKPNVYLTDERRQKLLDIGLCAAGSNLLAWEEKVELLRQYKEEFGDCNLTMNSSLPEKYHPLASFVNQNRLLMKAYDEEPSKPNRLTPERRQQLLDVGFIVDRKGWAWEEKFQLLKEYKEENDGNCYMPSKRELLPEKFKPLVTWTQTQRRELKIFEDEDDLAKEKLQMTAERRQRLLELGFKPTEGKGPTKEVRRRDFEEFFEKRISELRAFKAENGHLDVPKGTNLNNWLNKQRLNYKALQEGKESFLKLEHVVALTGLGFTMTSELVRRRMDVAIPEYVEWVKRNGRFPDPQSKDTVESRHGLAAPKWRLRRKLLAEGVMYRNKIGTTVIPPHLVEALDSVGFRWDSREGNYRRSKKVVPWQVRFEMLKAYKEKHGHCEPPKRHPKLGNFINMLRREYRYMTQGKRSSLTMEQFQKLSDLGFRFKPTKTGLSRQRYVDDAGYDTSSEEEEEEDDEGTPAKAAATAAQNPVPRNEEPNLLLAAGRVERASQNQDDSSFVAGRWGQGKSPGLSNFF